MPTTTVSAPSDLPGCQILHADGTATFCAIVAFAITDGKAEPIYWPAPVRGEAVAINIGTYEVDVDGVRYSSIERAAETLTGSRPK
jgi:hypothetical protein